MAMGDARWRLGARWSRAEAKKDKKTKEEELKLKLKLDLDLDLEPDLNLEVVMVERATGLWWSSQRAARSGATGTFSTQSWLT